MVDDALDMDMCRLRRTDKRGFRRIFQILITARLDQDSHGSRKKRGAKSQSPLSAYPGKGCLRDRQTELGVLVSSRLAVILGEDSSQFIEYLVLWVSVEAGSALRLTRSTKMSCGTRELFNTEGVQSCSGCHCSFYVFLIN